MLNRHWRRLLSEETDTQSVGAAIWTMIIFGGASALAVAYTLETRTHLPPLVRGFAAIACGLGVGGVAASFRWARYTAILFAALVGVAWLLRGPMTVAS